MNLDNLTGRALRALCDQIGAGRVRRENLRTAFVGILADLGGVQVATINTALSFMPPVAFDALMASVDDVWQRCSKAGVKPPHQAIEEALAATCTMVTAGLGHGNAVPHFLVMTYLYERVAEAAGIPARNGQTFWNENATEADRASLAACEAGGGGGGDEGAGGDSAGKKSVFPWVIGLGLALKFLL